MRRDLMLGMTSRTAAATTFISAAALVPPRVGRVCTTLPTHCGSVSSAFSDFGASAGFSLSVF